MVVGVRVVRALVPSTTEATTSVHKRCIRLEHRHESFFPFQFGPAQEVRILCLIARVIRVPSPPEEVAFWGENDVVSHRQQRLR